jgi:copper chaperone
MAGWPTVMASLTKEVFTMTEFNVPDMTCDHCVGRITRAINAVDAHARVEARIAERKVLIESGLGAERFAEAIREAGYTPVPV